MGHTHGPWNWEIYHDYGGKRAWRLITPINGHCIVMDFRRLGFQSAQPRFSDRGDAPLGGIMHDASEFEDLNDNPDARLMAAAPELLEALVYLVEAIESSMHGEESLHTWQCAAPDHGKCSCDAHPAMDVARAAIAKAKGDSTRKD